MSRLGVRRAGASVISKVRDVEDRVGSAQHDEDEMLSFISDQRGQVGACAVFASSRVAWA